MQESHYFFNKDGTWVKKERDTLFDVTMECFDGAKICELVDLCLIDKLLSLIGKENVGMYRDDGLNAINSSSEPTLDKMRKNTIALFKNEGQPITAETILFEKEFIDVTGK